MYTPECMQREGPVMHRHNVTVQLELAKERLASKSDSSLHTTDSVPSGARVMAEARLFVCTLEQEQ